MRFAIFMINICIYSHPFEIFINRKSEGLEILNVGRLEILNVGRLERPIELGDVSYEHGFNEVVVE
jgi:hypothetical protein